MAIVQARQPDNKPKQVSSISSVQAASAGKEMKSVCSYFLFILQISIKMDHLNLKNSLLSSMLLLLLHFAILQDASGQCTNITQWPETVVASNNSGIVQTIAEDQYEVEYSVISNRISGNTYSTGLNSPLPSPPLNDYSTKVTYVEEPVEPPVQEVTPQEDYSYYNYYYKGIKLDPYRILDIYKITCPAMQHAIKKLLRAGQAVKELKQDIKEVIDTLKRKLEMLEEDSETKLEVQD